MKLYKQVREYLDREKTNKNPAYKVAVWWCDFTTEGRRYRLTTDTANKTEAAKVAKQKEASAAQGKLSANSQSFARLTFLEASEKYIAGRKLELQASSLTKEKQLLVKLKEHFGSTRLYRISSEMILEYREQRGASCGPSLLNMEIGVLRRILKRGKLWHQFSDDIKPLKEPPTIGRALTPEQKATLLETAASRPEWQNAYLASVISLNSTLRGCEVRGLRWHDIDLAGNPPTLTINKGKTSASERLIPLSGDAFEAFIQLRTRAELFGPVRPEHYVFARFRSVARFEGDRIAERRIQAFDPTTPVRSWKKAWRNLTTRAELPGLRFHDCRHTSITELLSNPNVSIQTTKAIAGHVSQRMVDRYAHIHLESKRNAVAALATPRPREADVSMSTAEASLPC